jgi:hypothetical protein
MNVALVVVQRYRDGRLYPPRWWAIPPEVNERLRGLAHRLRCAEHLSYRQVQAAMLERFGERRSLGQVWADVHEFECRHCAATPAQPTPGPRDRPRAYAWR